MRVAVAVGGGAVGGVPVGVGTAVSEVSMQVPVHIYVLAWTVFTCIRSNSMTASILIPSAPRNSNCCQPSYPVSTLVFVVGNCIDLGFASSLLRLFLHTSYSEIKIVPQKLI